ncbi:MAG: hypothetical protein ACRDVG_10685 [Jatrophihabitantaceae bacterium]
MGSSRGAAQVVGPVGRATPVRPGGGRAASWLTLRQVQIAVGVLWLVDTAAQLQPYFFTTGYADDLSALQAGQPPVVARTLRLVHGPLAANIVLANSLIVVVQVVIGVGLLVPRTVRAAVVLSAVWAAPVWWVGEGFGGLLTGSSSRLTEAPGPVLLYVLIGLLAWPRPTGDGGVPARRASAAAGGLLGERGARAGWAVLWLGSAALSLQPNVTRPGEFSLRLATAGLDPSSGAAYEPGWLEHLDHVFGRLVAGHSVGLALGFAAAQALIALAVFVPRLRTLALFVGAGLSLAIWVIAQNFGGMLTGQESDVGTEPLMILLALTLIKPPAGTCRRRHARTHTGTAHR